MTEKRWVRRYILCVCNDEGKPFIGRIEDIEKTKMYNSARDVCNAMGDMGKPTNLKMVEVEVEEYE